MITMMRMITMMMMAMMLNLCKQLWRWQKLTATGWWIDDDDDVDDDDDDDGDDADDDDDDVDDDDDDEPMQAIVEVAEVDRLKSLPDQRLGQSHRHLFKILS